MQQADSFMTTSQKRYTLGEVFVLIIQGVLIRYQYYTTTIDRPGSKKVLIIDLNQTFTMQWANRFMTSSRKKIYSKWTLRVIHTSCAPLGLTLHNHIVTYVHSLLFYKSSGRELHSSNKFPMTICKYIHRHKNSIKTQ